MACVGNTSCRSGKSTTKFRRLFPAGSPSSIPVRHRALWSPEIREFPSTISPSKGHNFAPRLGLAYSPDFDHGILRAIFGDSSQSSIRASYGIFYTAIPGLSAGVMYAVPPFGYNYLSPGPPYLRHRSSTPKWRRRILNPFPLTFPPHNVSAKNPDISFDWPSVLPVAPILTFTIATLCRTRRTYTLLVSSARSRRACC